jgi:uncharacterized membrane protein
VSDDLRPATTGAAAGRWRLDSVDLLRGFVMVLMALDHTRDFFGNAPFNPTDLDRTSPALFLTRWVTHLCAPVFVFLAGTGAFLSTTTGPGPGSAAELSRRLVSRGLWLVVLDLIYFNTAWNFNPTWHWLSAMVLWAIGWSMVALAGFVWLPRAAVLAIGLVLIAGHNAMDGWAPESFGAGSGLWRVLHAGGIVNLTPGIRLAVTYPLIPWIGVMAVGFAFGPVLKLETSIRRRWLWGLGAGLIAAFVLIRGLNIYGDPMPWSVQKNGVFTVLSFLKCQKYPPSLCYLLMTLGPALILLAFFDGGTPRLLRPLVVFGRVPLFYYILHIPLIHGVYLAACLIRFGRADWSYGFQPGIDPQPLTPPNAGFGLGTVYGLWLLFVLALYPACCWFAALKKRRADGWLRYL